MKIGPNSLQVAKLAQVSQSAVSRTFTPGASVSEETRRKVLAAAKALGYRRNALARSLVTRRSRIVALVMRYLQNQFYPLVIEHLSQQLQKQGYHVLMFISETDAVDGVISDILQYQVDAIVMASVTLSRKLARSCADAGVPVIMFNRTPDIRPSSRPVLSSVTTNNYEGGRMVARVLLERGYEQIAFVAGLENSSTSVEREHGFSNALAEAGARVWRRAVGHYSFEGAQHAARELFAHGNRPDAVFIANDHMAIAVMDVLRTELGLRVPRDVGIVGFDDIPQAAWDSYRLTTVSQDVRVMVGATVELLHEQMRGESPPRSVVVPCWIVERASVRPAQRGRLQKKS